MIAKKRLHVRRFVVAAHDVWPTNDDLDLEPAPSGWHWRAHASGPGLHLIQQSKPRVEPVRRSDWLRDRESATFMYELRSWVRRQLLAGVYEFANAIGPYRVPAPSQAAKRPTSHYVEGYKGKTAGHRADQGGLRAHSCGELYPFRIVAHPNDEWSAVAPDGSKIIRAYSQCTAVKAARIARIAWQYGCPLTGLRHVVQAADLDEVHYV